MMRVVVVVVGKTSGQDQTTLGGLTSDWKKEKDGYLVYTAG
jgi:hypothetical protein